MLVKKIYRIEAERNRIWGRQPPLGREWSQEGVRELAWRILGMCIWIGQPRDFSVMAMPQEGSSWRSELSQIYIDRKINEDH